MAIYDPMTLEVHVLLVDHDMNKLLDTSRLLELNSYKVTAAHNIPAASSILSKGKTLFDLVIIDISSSNLEEFKLLHEAVSMDLTVILMSSNIANATLAKCAIEDGAFLFMEKPTKVEELKYLWQHVLREKMRKNRVKAISMNQYVSTNKEKSCGKGTDLQHINCISSEINFADSFTRSKFCTEWTPELHEKFMAAVRQLGEGRCFPKDILDLMNVPGLTRMQVASHLQKCRHGWQPPNERQNRRSKYSKSANSSDSYRHKTKRYGFFPRLSKGNSKQGPVAENSTPRNNSENIGEKSSSFNNAAFCNMNEFSIENVVGDMVAPPNQGLQSDASFDFLTDNDAPIPNNFDLQYLDYDHIVPAGDQTNDEADRQQESEFWTSWIANFAMD